MSLGPPFDDSPLATRRQLVLGSAALVALLVTIVGILALSSRTLGRGEHLFVRMRLPGALREGSKLRLAGREIGEIRSIVPDQKGVLIDAFVLRDWLPHIHRNSEVFVSSVSILGEAHLEVGPPRDGAELLPSVGANDEIRGTDPPDLDELLRYTLDNAQQWMKLLAEVRPETVELFTAGSALMQRVRALPLSEQQWSDMITRGVAMFGDARKLSAAIDSAGGTKRVLADARAVAQLLSDKSPELGSMLDEARRQMDRTEAVIALFSDGKLDGASHAWEQLKRVGRSMDAIEADATWLVNRVKSGKGTLGGFWQDQELWDDLHDSHKTIKQQPWNLILKGDKSAIPKKPR